MITPTLTTLVLLAIWEAVGRAGVLSNAVSPFSTAVSWIWSELTVGPFWTAVGQTMWHWFAGFALGGGAGLLLGLVLGTMPVVQRLLNVSLEMLRPVPAIIYLPLLILIMGARSQTAIVLAAVGAFWPMLYQTVYGVRAVDRVSVETGKVFGLSPRQRLTRIVAPSLAPYLGTGARIASSLALVVAVSIEQVGGVPGLGAQLETAAENAVYPALYGILLVSGVIGLVLNMGLERVERRVLHWHVAYRATTS